MHGLPGGTRLLQYVVRLARHLAQIELLAHIAGTPDAFDRLHKAEGRMQKRLADIEPNQQERLS